MNFKRLTNTFILLILGTLLAVSGASGTEVFIHRPGINEIPLTLAKKLIVHGEVFINRLSPSTFPSYNDLSGPADVWNFGFQNYFPITETTTLMAQLVTHDDGQQRTKFDWHFHLRQAIIDNLVVIIGHDSDHDSEHTSLLQEKPFYTNRNYIGVGIPVEGRNFYIEPFTWFFHHSNQRAHLDLSGGRLRQEYGLRASAWAREGISAHAQAVFQTVSIFTLGQAFMGELIIRLRLASWLELSIGGSVWTDIKLSALGVKQSFHKISWGVAIPF